MCPGGKRFWVRESMQPKSIALCVPIMDLGLLAALPNALVWWQHGRMSESLGQPSACIPVSTRAAVRKAGAAQHRGGTCFPQRCTTIARARRNVYCEVAPGLGETLASGTRGTPWRLRYNKDDGRCALGLALLGMRSTSVGSMQWQHVVLW